MTPIDSRRHFIFLVCAVLLLPELVEPGVRAIDDLSIRLYAYFGLIGLLNALTWLLALRGPASAIRQAAFAAVATVLSAGAPHLGTSISAALFASDDSGDLLLPALAVASALGAATYWLAVRWFWLPRLAWSSLGLSVVACVAATSSAVVVNMLITGFESFPEALRLDYPTILWWLAFSLSTLWGQPQEPKA